MIEKLYNLKKTQTDQKLMQKAQLQSEIERIDSEIMLTQGSINSASVQKFGAISDFTVLTMHKNTMRSHIKKLEKQKNDLNLQLEDIINQVIELQKEAEQFGYLLEEDKKNFRCRERGIRRIYSK